MSTADDLVGWHFLLLKSFDPAVSEVLCAAGRGSERQVMWDIGANKGACAYAVATELPCSQVVLIEPQASLSELLEHNMQKLAPGRFELHAVGVGIRQEMLELVIPGDNKGRASLVLDVGTEDCRKVMVPMRSAKQIADSSAFGWPTLAERACEAIVPEATDYAVIRDDLLGRAGVRRMIA
jgi:FkbM family methyltransferase